MAAFCKLVILLVTLVSFMPPPSSVTALRCLVCVAVEGGTDIEGNALVEPKGRISSSRKGVMISSFVDLMGNYGTMNPSADNQACMDANEELQAICDVDAIACVTERLKLTDDTFRAISSKEKYHSDILRRKCSSGPVHPQCKKESFKWKDVRADVKVNDKDLGDSIAGEIETCACHSDNCNLAGSLRGISMDKLIGFLFVVLVFRAAR